MATFIQLIGLLIGVGIFAYVALRLIGHEHLLKKNAARVDHIVVETYESTIKNGGDLSRVLKTNSEIILKIEDLKREVKEREL